MLDKQFLSIGGIVSENIRLKDEALGWHARAAKLEDEKRELEIEIAALKDQIKTLAIENVKLLNEPPKDKKRQYATDFSSHEPLQDNDGNRDASSHQPVQSATG